MSQKQYAIYAVDGDLKAGDGRKTEEAARALVERKGHKVIAVVEAANKAEAVAQVPVPAVATDVGAIVDAQPSDEEMREFAESQGTSVEDARARLEKLLASAVEETPAPTPARASGGRRPFQPDQHDLVQVDTYLVSASKIVHASPDCSAVKRSKLALAEVAADALDEHVKGFDLGKHACRYCAVTKKPEFAQPGPVAAATNPAILDGEDHDAAIVRIAEQVKADKPNLTTDEAMEEAEEILVKA